jgi:hypothetical protein
MIPGIFRHESRPIHRTTDKKNSRKFRFKKLHSPARTDLTSRPGTFTLVIKKINESRTKTTNRCHPYLRNQSLPAAPPSIGDVKIRGESARHGW